MKTHPIIIFSMICLLMLSYTAVKSQQLIFYYVAPKASMESTFGAAAVEGFRDTANNIIMSGYRFVEITPANMAQFRAIAAGNMLKTYDSITTNTSRLRRKLNRVMELAGPRLSLLAFFLTNDSTIALPANTPNFFCPTGGADSYAWPCAANWKDGNTYIGRVNLGETAAIQFSSGTGSFRDWEATIIHEVSHTQMLRDTIAVNKWDSPTTDGILISYGGDENHFGFELQADEQTPLDEGLGTFWAIEHNPALATELDDFLNKDSERFAIESHSVLAGTAEIWNARHAVLCNGIPCNFWSGYSASPADTTLPLGAGYQIRGYRWLDVPGSYLMYNEMMAQAYFYLYHKYAFATQDTAFNKIFNAVKILCNNTNQRHRYPAHAANILANSMESYARTPRGQQEAANGSLVSSMFAYALLDLMGHFGRTEEDLRRAFNIQSATYIPYTPKPLAFNHYWAHRDQVKQLACQHLGGNGCGPVTNGPLDIHRAAVAIRDYFKDATRILQ